MRSAILPAVFLAATAVLSAAQDVLKPAFEVAAIKPSDPNSNGSSSNTRNNRIVIKNWTLKRMVQRAYNVKDFQITGGPNWTDSARYDIDAKEDGSAEKLTGPARLERWMAEWQALLADRFQVVVHRETKTLPVYHMVVAKGGLKISPVASTDGSTMNSSRTWLNAKGVSMQNIAGWLSDQMERPVLDASEIPGVFDFRLEWTPDVAPSAKTPETDAPAGPSIFTAIQEQLGLRLEAGKGPVEIIVIDHAEKPTEN